MNSLRPCRVNIGGEIHDALFHGWFSRYWTRAAILQGEVSGQFSNIFALVELANGAVKRVFPESICFLDSYKQFDEFDECFEGK